MTIISALAMIAATLIHIPLIIILLLIGAVSCGVAIAIVSSCIVESYPTNLRYGSFISKSFSPNNSYSGYSFNRAMALCLLSMFGRFGSLAITNAIGVLLETHCDITFTSIGVMMISGYFQIFFK